AMGLASACGSVGQVLLVPLAQGAIDHWSSAAALALLGSLALFVAPLGYFLQGNGLAGPLPAPQPRETLRSALGQALSNDGFCLLTLGFFSCGFQLAFIATHLPAYLGLCGIA